MKFIVRMGEEVIALGDGYMITRNKNPRLEVERVQCMESSLVLNETLAAHEIRLIVISR